MISKSLLFTFVILSSSLIAQEVTPPKVVLGLSTNIFSFASSTRDINLTFHVFKALNDFSIGLDFGLAKRKNPTDEIESIALDPSGVANKINLTWRRNFTVIGENSYALLELRYHENDWIYTNMGMSVSAGGGGGFGGPILPSSVSGFRDRYAVSLEKFVPAIGFGKRANFSESFFVNIELKIGYAFITKAHQKIFESRNNHYQGGI